MSEIEKKWYVLRAISGKEAKVKEYLEADIKNSDLGDYVSQVLIPTEKVYQVRNGKKIVKERSYLPGYVLVEAALVGEVAHHLRNTPNVIGFLGGSEKPVPLRQSEVNRILGTVDELQDAGEELNIPYVVGETVKVNYGPFSGFSGIIEEVNTEKKKLKVMVKIFGRKTPLELGFMQVEWCRIIFPRRRCLSSRLTRTVRATAIHAWAVVPSSRLMWMRIINRSITEDLIRALSPSIWWILHAPPVETWISSGRSSMREWHSAKRH